MVNNAKRRPDENAASRFLSQATLGYDYSDIISVTEAGIEAWIVKPADHSALFYTRKQDTPVP